VTEQVLQTACEAQARLRFFFPPTWKRLAGPLAVEIDSAPPPFHALGHAFRRNIVGAVASVSMPFKMAFASIEQRRLQALHAAERVRARKRRPKEGTAVGSSEETVLQTARERMQAEWQNLDFRTKVADQVFLELVRGLDNEALSAACAELLRQGVELAWGALEVFARDFFVAIVNVRTELARRLVESDQTGHAFQLQSVPFALLAEYGFNLRSRLGQLLAARYDIGSIPAMRAVFGVLFPDNGPLAAALDDRMLWLLAERRQLIVRRRSLVDANYVKAAAEPLPLGSELIVTPDDLERYMRSGCDVVRQLLLAARAIC